METVQHGYLSSIISDKHGATGWRQSLRDLQVSEADEDYLLVDSIKGSRMKRIKSRERFEQRMAPQSPVNWPFVKPEGTRVDGTLLTSENMIDPRL